MIKTIGVVAGAGPYAGLDLLNKIFEQTIAVNDQDHLDVIGLFRSSRLPDRTAFLLDQRLPNPGIAIAQQALELERMGAGVAAIPCNTAHAPLIFNRMKAELAAGGSKIRFLNMIEETVAYVRKNRPDLKRLGVLATTGSYRAELYPQYFVEAELEPVVPDEDVQLQKVHPAIYDAQYGIKANGRATDRARGDLADAIAHLAEKGAQAVILGCTEIPLAFSEPSLDGIVLLDPTLILARALIREAAPEKLKPEN